MSSATEVDKAGPMRPPTPITLASPAVGGAAEVRALERRLMEEWGFPALLLMERAALALLHVLESQYGDAPVVVFAGTGHNGGDGLALARMLLDRGRTVRVLTTGMPQGEAPNKQSVWLAKRGVTPKTFAGSETFGPEWVLVDALFGIGLDRALSHQHRLAVDWINGRRWRGVLAVDLPSGLAADTGVAQGACVRADVTVAIGALKPGLLSDSALAVVGRLYLADIGYPPELASALTGRLNAPGMLPVLGRDAHKGQRGTVLLVAGSAMMTGAALLAARAAARSGVGLVYLAVPSAQREAIAAALPEAIVVPLPSESGGIGPEALAPLLQLLPRVSALGIGPGLGRTERVKALVARLLTAYEGPVVLDADALPRDELLPARKGPLVLTPHPGEAARMVGASADEVQSRRLATAQAIASRHRALVVLKGARSVIARPDGAYAINATGTPLLATAGSGDVLTGLLTGLLARGLEAYDAACTAVYAHGLAGEAAEAAGMTTLLAGDLVERLPAVLGTELPLPSRLGDARLIHT